jgi:Tol biopolymer transport system component
VAFQSAASNLVAGDNNGSDDIYVHDTVTATTTRVSLDSAGVEGNGFSSEPSISGDGRYVAFQSAASNLVAGDNNGSDDIYVHDTVTATTTRVSVDSAGTEGNSSSSEPSISRDGRYVVFTSVANNLVAGDTNGWGDIYVHDTVTATTTRVSVDSAGVEVSGANSEPSISGDGRYVAFRSAASNLVRGIPTAGMISMFTTPSPRRPSEYRWTAPGSREIISAPSPASAGMGVMWRFNRLPATWWRGIPTAVVTSFARPTGPSSLSGFTGAITDSDWDLGKFLEI